MPHSRTMPPRRRFVDGNIVPDDVYTRRPENRAYLRGGGDAPPLSKWHHPSFALTYLLAAFVCGCVLAVMHADAEVTAETRLARDGTTTLGEITATVAMNAGKSDAVLYYLVYFRYTVAAGRGRGEETYTGIGRTEGPRLPNTLQPEKLVTVRYLPDAPHLAQVVSPPLRRSESDLQEGQGIRILTLPLLLYPPLFAWSWWARRRERQMSRGGLLLRAEIVGVRRIAPDWWERDEVTYRFRLPEGTETTAQFRVAYTRHAPKVGMIAAVLYLHERRFVLL